MKQLTALGDRWRAEAETFRRYGDERGARACELHADELEAAMAAARLEAVTLEEACKIGGYSYSHLQHMVADGTLENIGTKGAPRIRRAEVPRKPRHGNGSAKEDALVGQVIDARQRGAP